MTSSTALVFGGSSGIGRACAAALAEAGLAVTIVGRDRARASAAASEIGAGVTGLETDALDDAAVAGLFGRVAAPSHVVVSLAGGSALGPFSTLEAEALRRSLEIKLFGYLTVARHALRVLQPGGSLTFVTGVAGMKPSPGAACLAIANTAIHGLVETLAVEAAPVRVNAVAPGTTDTPAWERIAPTTRASMFEAMAAKTPLGRVGRSEDVAEVVLALVRHPFLTGLVIPCDGGLRLT